MRRTLSYLLSALMMTTVATGCATTIEASTTAPALGSDAKIVAKKGKTGNFEISISIINLAPAARLDEGATAFVVWVVHKDQPAVRSGSLDYDEKDRRGELQVTSPDSSFTILITLEKTGQVSSPGGKRILEQAVTVR